MSTENKWDNCVIMTNGGRDGCDAHPCPSREQADRLAKHHAEQSGEEIAIYQLVGVWKPKALPVEFVAAEKEKMETREYDGPSPMPSPKRGAPVGREEL